MDRIEEQPPFAKKTWFFTNSMRREDRRTSRRKLSTDKLCLTTDAIVFIVNPSTESKTQKR
jgi:hypothetical protein